MQALIVSAWHRTFLFGCLHQHNSRTLLPALTRLAILFNSSHTWALVSRHSCLATGSFHSLGSTTALLPVLANLIFCQSHCLKASHTTSRLCSSPCISNGLPRRDVRSHILSTKPNLGDKFLMLPTVIWPGAALPGISTAWVDINGWFHNAKLQIFHHLYKRELLKFLSSWICFYC